MLINNKPSALVGAMGAHPIAASAGAALLLAGIVLSVPFVNAAQCELSRIAFSGIYGCARTFVCDAALLLVMLSALARRFLLPLSCAALIADGLLTGAGFLALLRYGSMLWAMLYILPCAMEAAAMLLGFITASTGARGGGAKEAKMAFCCLFMLLTSASMQGVIAALIAANN